MQSVEITDEMIASFLPLMQMRMAKFKALPQEIQDSYNKAAANKTPEQYAAQQQKSMEQFDEADKDGDGILDQEECYNYHLLT